MNDLEQKLKEGLLEDLIAHMSNGMGDHMKPKSMAVEVAAPDESKLAEGLDKAKDVLGDSDAGDSDEESDESRLMQLLDDEDEEDDKGMRG